MAARTLKNVPTGLLCHNAPNSSILAANAVNSSNYRARHTILFKNLCKTFNLASPFAFTVLNLWNTVKKEKRSSVVLSSASVTCVLHLGASRKPLKALFCSVTLGSAKDHRFNA